MAETHPATLDGIALFANLTAAERAALARSCRWRRYGAQEQIIDRQSDSKDIFFVIDGAVRVVIYSASGREIAFDDVKTGGFFGEIAAIDGKPRSASIVAVTDTQVAVMSPTTFRETLQRTPALAFSVLQHMARILRQSTERILDLSTLGANNRVHAELLRLARPELRPDNTALIDPVPIHSDIAARVSTTRETVARVLSDLARSGLVERRGNTLAVNDFKRLEHMVQELRGE
ncbi:MAG TPA: Crp/Fnr family transcriptional regulator [Alphaproteobacteria bacterium]|nr:Crp/Fnr family transcriptional regulator [Alphaproteobacteria bacterium]